jgi:hypothetical protein
MGAICPKPTIAALSGDRIAVVFLRTILRSFFSARIASEAIVVHLM